MRLTPVHSVKSGDFVDLEPILAGLSRMGVHVSPQEETLAHTQMAKVEQARSERHSVVLYTDQGNWAVPKGALIWVDDGKLRLETEIVLPGLIRSEKFRRVTVAKIIEETYLYHSHRVYTVLDLISSRVGKDLTEEELDSEEVMDNLTIQDIRVLTDDPNAGVL